MRPDPRSILTMRQRRRIARARVELRRPSSPLRRRPDFIIIGAQRAGTSSLYRHLSAHPDVRRPLRKEVDYFSTQFERNWSWYLAHFPIDRPTIRTFEATPQYLFHPLAPPRIAESLPDVRFVVVVRDPVERAKSQYRHMVSLGHERRSLDDALEAELSASGGPTLDGELSVESLRHAYVARSRYSVQLERWLEHFHRDQLHIVVFEELIARPQGTFDELLHFTGLAPWMTGEFGNASSKAQASASPSPTMLTAALAGEPSYMSELLGRAVPWA